MAVALLIPWSGYCGLQAMLRCLVVFIPTKSFDRRTDLRGRQVGITCIEDKCCAQYSISWLYCSVRRSLWCPLWRLLRRKIPRNVAGVAVLLDQPSRYSLE